MMHDSKWMAAFVLLLGMLLTLPCMADGSGRELADRLYAGRKYQQAIEAYQALLPSQPDSAGELHLQIAMARRYLGTTAAAIADFEAALATGQLTPRQVGKAKLERGYCLYMNRRYDEGLATLKEVMADRQATPDSRQEAGMYAGYLLNKIGRTPEAIAMFEAAAAEQDTLPAARAAALLAVADTHRRLKAYDDARAMYHRIAAMGGDVGAIGVKAKTRLEELDAELAGDTPFYIPPYLTRLSAERAELFWVRKGELKDVSVALQASGVSVPVVLPIEAKALSQAGYHRQRAVLAPLTPWTRYHYNVQADGQSRQGTFTTPPPAGVDRGLIRFSVMSDTQTNAIAHAAVAPGVARHDPAFVVHCGDFVESGTRWLEWKSQFFDPGNAYLSRSAFWPTRGNHDGGNFYAPLFGLEEKQFYSFDYGPIHFVVLDSFGPHASAKGRALQAQWLKEDLASTKAKWIFVAVHDPLVNNDYTLPWWGYEEIFPIVQSMGVDIVFSGHHHLYRRYLPLQMGDHKPVLHVTTGGSGGTLSGAVVSPISMVMAEEHHHLNLTVEGDTLTMESVDTQGNVLDSITLHKRDGRYQQEVMDQAVSHEVARQLGPIWQHMLALHTNNVIPATYETPVRPGQEVTIAIDTSKVASGKLDLEAFPKGTRLVFSQAESSPWKLQTQEVLLTDGVLRFKAIAPKNMAVHASGAPAAAAQVMVNVRLGDRLFVPHLVVLRPIVSE